MQSSIEKKWFGKLKLPIYVLDEKENIDAITHWHNLSLINIVRSSNDFILFTTFLNYSKNCDKSKWKLSCPSCSWSQLAKTRPANCLHNSLWQLLVINVCHHCVKQNNNFLFLEKNIDINRDNIQAFCTLNKWTKDIYRSSLAFQTNILYTNRRRKYSYLEFRLINYITFEKRFANDSIIRLKCLLHALMTYARMGKRKR